MPSETEYLYSSWKKMTFLKFLFVNIPHENIDIYSELFADVISAFIGDFHASNENSPISAWTYCKPFQSEEHCYVLLYLKKFIYQKFSQLKTKELIEKNPAKISADYSLSRLINRFFDLLHDECTGYLMYFKIWSISSS